MNAQALELGTRQIQRWPLTVSKSLDRSWIRKGLHACELYSEHLELGYPPNHLSALVGSTRLSRGRFVGSLRVCNYLEI